MQRVKQKNGHGDTICFKAIGYPLICLFALVCIIPFFLIIASSFTSESYIIKNGYVLWPKEFSTSAYELIFKNPAKILRAYGVTAFVTIIGTALSVFVNAMTGYVLQRKDFRWRNIFSFYFFFTTLFSGGLVPWYILCVKTLHLKNTIWALIIPTIVSVWNIILVKGFMGGVPGEITESAKIDGAGDFRIFVKLILPLSKPVVATIGLFTALAYWNDWYMCMLFIDKKELFDLQYLLYQLMGSIKALREIASQSTISVSSMPIESTKMALTIVATGPIILVYPFVQKYFVKGLTLGSVKG
ncbi:sugar ABC transporter permease [Eisenbergiella tayi]|uniref:Sugar ABC transporter permease n=1 Tax=Eisenbergiella tayi TaxID=1432052 RepID=A0A1E3U9Z5_9FIRM|nr:carbohydrate ABC transporter permease [Eisenbergiella tayi]ODR45132.1 sugar ABC transporter permease [Eisenbergiella tayi]